jgi:hypothetical protein
MQCLTRKEEWCHHCCWQQLDEEPVEGCKEVQVPAGYQQLAIVGHNSTQPLQDSQQLQLNVGSSDK